MFNPGRFVGNSYTFSAYAPARRESEEWYVIPSSNSGLCPLMPLIRSVLDIDLEEN